MKRTIAANFFINLLLILFFFWLLVSVTSCKKGSDGDPKDPPAAPPTVPETPGTPTCNATKAAAELIQMFPADNAWNKDLSQSPVDPYTQDASSNFQINQGQHLDEIRVYPADALLTTITYDVLYGKTSETDSNNRTTFYEYDVLGRLISVRDNDKNIVKKLKYNYIIH